jgi:hypothetical protein
MPHGQGLAEVSERRVHHRRPTSLEAEVLLGAEALGLSCVVRDISAGGAGLTFAEPIELPSGFVLTVPKLDLIVAAQLRWSHGERHGVAFMWPQHRSRASSHLPRRAHG